MIGTAICTMFKVNEILKYPSLHPMYNSRQVDQHGMPGIGAMLYNPLTGISSVRMQPIPQFLSRLALQSAPWLK